MKRLMRHPPLVKLPVAFELLNSQPFIGALPADVREPLVSAAKESMKWRGTVLYNEGSIAEGIWLIANGILQVSCLVKLFQCMYLDPTDAILGSVFWLVQWSTRAAENNRASDSTFYHASVLGLYESLTGRPYLCSISCDSLVHCFFIERTKVVAALQSEPELEEYFWQVCGTDLVL